MQATHAINTTAIIGKAQQLWAHTYRDSVATGAARGFEEEEIVKVPHPDTLMPSAVNP